MEYVNGEEQKRKRTKSNKTLYLESNTDLLVLSPLVRNQLSYTDSVCLNAQGKLLCNRRCLSKCTRKTNI